MRPSACEDVCSVNGPVGLVCILTLATSKGCVSAAAVRDVDWPHRSMNDHRHGPKQAATPPSHHGYVCVLCAWSAEASEAGAASALPAETFESGMGGSRQDVGRAGLHLLL
jgi:hypothetical protein